MQQLQGLSVIDYLYLTPVKLINVRTAPKMLTIANIFFLLHSGSVGTIQSTGADGRANRLF